MFHGSLVALISPMNEQGDVDFASLTRLVDFHLDNQTDGIVAVGSTGESATMSPAEQQQVIAHVVEQVNGRIPVIAGSGAVSTVKTIELTRAAMELGVDGCLLMTPPYIKPTQEGLYRHYMTVADAVHVPQILYNVPGRTAVDLLPETVERLAVATNIIGIKEATGSLERAQEILQRCGDKLDLYGGDDPITKDLILAGGKGVISVTANVTPQLMHDLCEAALAGDAAKANSIHEKLDGLFTSLFVEANPIPVKWAVAEMGLAPKGIRLPLTPLSEQYYNQVKLAMQQVGVIHP